MTCSFYFLYHYMYTYIYIYIYIIDEKRSWKQIIEYVKNKISKSFGIIYMTRIYVDKSRFRNSDDIFVSPYLIYCVEVWGNF